MRPRLEPILCTLALLVLPLQSSCGGSSVPMQPSTRSPVASLSPPPPAPEATDPKAVLLGRWTTRFRQQRRGRSHNVETAAAALHGAQIPARGQLSFNERVGKRSRDRGYRRAPVIKHGELVSGLGGGVCQVSSTLYGAAYVAGLEFPEHRVHSRPVSYMPAGLDATVAWPRVDLVLTNPFSFPVYVEAEVSAGTLTVSLYGETQPRQVAYTRQVRRGRRFDEVSLVDPSLPAGARRVAQRGRRGRVVRRSRQIQEHGRAWVEEDTVVYPPVNEIVRVGVESL